MLRLRHSACSLFLLVVTTASASQDQTAFSTAARNVLYRGAASLTLEVLEHHGSRPDSGASEQRERNTLLSPLALALSFAVVLEGSVAGTIDRILETLHWQLLRDPDIRYVMARSLHRLSQLPNDSVRVEAAAFVQRDFDVVRAYRESLDTYYGADVLLVNFLDQRAALVAINSWACRVTSRVILRLLLDKTSEIDSKSRFVATAVLTLKLAFDRPFLNPKVQLPFFTSPVESQSVESMYTTGTFGYKRNTDRGFDAVALPLLSGNLSLLLLMPVDGSTLAAVRKTLVTHPDLLLNLEAEMDPTIVEVTLPRFKVTAVCGLKSALTSLGHDFLFDRFKTNMGAVSRHGHAYVSNILNAVSLDVGPITTTTTTSGHDTDAPVNEATDASMTNPAVSFHVNKPFIYVVADKTDGLPLAVGQFVDPSGTANEATSKL